MSQERKIKSILEAVDELIDICEEHASHQMSPFSLPAEQNREYEEKKTAARAVLLATLERLVS